MIITPTSLNINQLLGSTNEQYVIPTYQRRYSWHEKQVWELIDDILLIEEGDTHLLGSIVCLAGHHKAGLNRLELVDGQQRLTTISIVLECIRQRFVEAGQKEEASEVGRLLTAKPLGGKASRKVLLDSIDAKDFDQLIDGQGKQQEIAPNPQLANAFGIVRTWVNEQPIDKLAKFLYRLMNQAIVIRLDVSEAKDAFKLFETINNRGLRLSPTDLIKNFLLGNAARFGIEELQSARASWTQLILHLDNTNSDAFFRYYLMSLLKNRVTAAEVVTLFRTSFMTQVIEADKLPERHLYADPDDVEEEEQGEALDGSAVESNTIVPSHISFEEFLAKLVASAKVYGELVLGKTGNVRVDRHLRNLKMIKAVQTYGFLMHLRVGKCGEKQFRDVLKLTESFVLRRHICRERSNDTEALFAKLCSVDPLAPVEQTKRAYRDLCPGDYKFKSEFGSVSFPANLIDRARYCLERIELSKHGKHEELSVLGTEEVHVEHIIPQKIRTKKAKEEFGDWLKYLGDKAEALHPKYVSRIGNMTIVAGALNIGASNNPFVNKKQAYKTSGLKLTLDLIDLPRFKFKEVEERSEALAEMAVRLWPVP